MAGLILKIQAKLANPGFLAKAPSEVVKEEETKMADYQMIMDQERKNLADLE
jgi:valyl-tRNA synthetase